MNAGIWKGLHTFDHIFLLGHAGRSWQYTWDPECHCSTACCVCAQSIEKVPVHFMVGIVNLMSWDWSLFENILIYFPRPIRVLNLPNGSPCFSLSHLDSEFLVYHGSFYHLCGIQITPKCSFL